MDDLKLYDVEFMSVQGYSGRAVARAQGREEAQELTKKALEEAGYITTSGDMYDIIILELGEEPNSLLLGIIGT